MHSRKRCSSRRCERHRRSGGARLAEAVRAACIADLKTRATEWRRWRAISRLDHGEALEKTQGADAEVRKVCRSTFFVQGRLSRKDGTASIRLGVSWRACHENVFGRVRWAGHCSQRPAISSPRIRAGLLAR